VLIGVLLTGVSFVIGRETKGLLIGEGMSREAVVAIRKIVQSVPGVERAECPLTMYFGPGEVLLAIDVVFSPDSGSPGLAQTIDRIEEAVKHQFPQISRIYVEAQALAAGESRAPSSEHARAQ
jgi:divalent metal cation (Fe/Co/Zn/Cd) transporter